MRKATTMRTTHIMKSALVALGLASACFTAQAAFNPAFQAPSTGPAVSGNANDPVNLGMYFTPNYNITVNALGFYDTPGVTAGEYVGIFNASGTLLTSVFVPQTGTLQSGYIWQSITPVVLSAGQQYTVDAYTGYNPWSYGGVPIVNSAITYHDNDQTYHYTLDGLTFPTDTGGHAPDAYYGPNFSIVAVPEPTTIVSGALALLLPLVVSARRMLRKSRAA
jgi:hypothetical protein